MRAAEHSSRCARIALFALAAGLGCRRAPPPAPPPPATAAAAGPEALLAGVVDPWGWPRAAGATAREQAIENIGPYEHDRPGEPISPLVNTNAHYWTALAGIAWTRDVDIDFDGEPVDLDADGRPDTRVTRHVHAKGGVLANPELFGLTPTPDDPRGRVGRISASTGVLGLREALRPDGTPSGEIGMTCWLCHGGLDPANGRAVLGLPGASFDYGLLLATAAVLDDRNTEAVAARTARGFPSGRAVRARLLLAGPGRQDLTGEFGLDVTVPGYHSARYPGTARVRQGTRGLVNPISVPGILAAPGLALENWSGSEEAGAPWLERLSALAQLPEAPAARTFGLVLAANVAKAEVIDREVARRALLFDLRNLGTLGLQHDSFPGLLWADAIYGRAQLSPQALRAVPKMYAAAAVRGVIAAGPPRAPRPADPAAVARGRALFTDKIVGAIANRQILKRPPRAYAAARLEGPVLAPIDSAQPLDAKLEVRCADCHAGAPLEQKRPLAKNPPPLGNCTHCHVTHTRVEGSTDVVSLRADPDQNSRMEDRCAECHTQHRDFGPLVYSSSLLFPFDANGDGDAQLNPEADRHAGGIGTDPWLAFDVPRDQWPFSVELPTVSDANHAGRVGHARTGMSWVRPSPLFALRASAPYLHNGSVPTLRALLEPPAKRPKAFPLGRAGFTFDTRLPGNGNQGHDFGTALSPDEKADLLAFLETL